MNQYNSTETKDFFYQPKAILDMNDSESNMNQYMLNHTNSVVNRNNMNLNTNKFIDSDVSFNQNYDIPNLGLQTMMINHQNEPSVLLFANPVILEAIPVHSHNSYESQFWMCEVSNKYGSNCHVSPYSRFQNWSFALQNNRINFENLEEVKQVIGSYNPNMTKDEMYDEMLKTYNYEKVIEMDEITHKQKISYVWKYGEWNKSYTKIWNLLDHVRMHEGIRPFKCKFWPKSFTQKGNLKKHQIQHTISTLKERKRFKCNICHKGYTEKYNLEVKFD